MLGIRYLNAHDTTFIAEYYHNGAGYDRGQIKDFFSFQESAVEAGLSTGNDSLIRYAAEINRSYHRQINFGRDYFYLKITQKEPLGILYFNPWAGMVMNLNDGSFSFQPGLTWAPVTDLEINLRIGIPMGAEKSEFGEKPDSLRPEFWLRYYF